MENPDPAPSRASSSAGSPRSDRRTRRRVETAGTWRRYRRLDPRWNDRSGIRNRLRQLNTRPLRRRDRDPAGALGKDPARNRETQLTAMSTNDRIEGARPRWWSAAKSAASEGISARNPNGTPTCEVRSRGWRGRRRRGPRASPRHQVPRRATLSRPGTASRRQCRPVVDAR